MVLRRVVLSAEYDGCEYLTTGIYLLCEQPLNKITTNMTKLQAQYLFDIVVLLFTI
ncbi:hypothetical protein MNB_SV-6-1332 [hydrothermal vent metagenome]|uniref:Uncharacterized protein n=1 Tax=hydrothermal vent metagenome TaxID=652676 RepID=A0A1W1BEQ4_9ZZZZ